jgi:hypothetical protein
MYGTVARLQVKPDAVPLLMAWVEGMLHPKESPERLAGWLSSTIYRSDQDPNVYWMAVVFDSRESYRRNAEHPNQDREYRRLRACLEADPEWFDGDIVGHTVRSPVYFKPTDTLAGS